MKFLIDAQLLPGLVRWFAARGLSANHVYDLGLGAASDVENATLAEAENVILVSKDEDFLVLRLPDRFALPWMRCGNATNRALTQWMDERWDRVAELLASGERFVELR
jgi:predicted nuclease of predicted toxin-antitoxin system